MNGMSGSFAGVTASGLVCPELTEGPSRPLWAMMGTASAPDGAGTIFTTTSLEDVRGAPSLNDLNNLSEALRAI